MHVQPGLEVPDDELTFTAARAGGPGGQHVNKTSTKVVLRFDLAASAAFSAAQKERLRRRLPARYLTQQGEVVISAEEHRDQHRNREACREKLAAAIRQALRRPKRRIPTKPGRAARERRLKGKKEQAQKKRSRQERFD